MIRSAEQSPGLGEPTDTAPGEGRSLRRFAALGCEFLAVTGGFAFATFLALYPVFRHLDAIYRPDSFLGRPVARWVMWVMAWDLEALSRGPSGLFDANVFHPVPSALAFGDPMLGLLPLFAPIYWVTGDLVASYQVALLATISLCGACMYALVRHWGCSRLAAVLAGLVYALCPVRLEVLAELPLATGQYLPLLLLLSDRVVRSPSAARVAALFSLAAWQVLCGLELAYLAVAVGLSYLVGLRLSGHGSRLGWIAALLALVSAFAVCLLVYRPYWDLVGAGLLVEQGGAGLLAVSGVGWRDYFVPPYLADALPGASGHYVGLVALVLAVIGVASSWWRAGRRPAVFGLGIVFFLSCAMSLGTGAESPYKVLAGVVPGLAQLGPSPGRYTLGLMLAIGGLVGMGADALATALRSRGARRGAIALCGVLLILDFQLPERRYSTERVGLTAAAMPLYESLAGMPDGAVLELPTKTCAVDPGERGIDRQLASTVHWKPLLDGYGYRGRAPVTAELVQSLAAALPDARALDVLQRATGVRYVVVHLADAAGRWRHRWRSPQGLGRIGFFGQDALFEVTEPKRPDLQEALLSVGREQTLLGNRLDAVPTVAGSAQIEFTDLPARRAVAGQRLPAELRVTNRSSETWPALTLDRERKVYVSYLWTDSAGGLVGGDARSQALAFDLRPGESVVIPVCVAVPEQAGELDLAFGLSQTNLWFEDLSERIRVAVRR